MNRPRYEPVADVAFGRDLDSEYLAAQARLRGVDDERKRLAQCAPNAIEWGTGSGWCNLPSLYTHVRQYQVIRDFFELRCPLCNEGGTDDGEPGDCWGKGRETLEAETLLVWSNTYDEDVCPRCRVTRTELTDDGFFIGYNQLLLVVGQRAGKSQCAALIGTYVEHKLATIGLTIEGGLPKYFDVARGEAFEITFLAATDVQSQDTIWTKFTALREESPWFVRFVPWVKRQQAAQPRIEGIKPWLYNETTKKITNELPGLKMIMNSLNSNAPGLRGRTRLAAFADELSHMDQTDSKKSATEIYNALERSLTTVRAVVFENRKLPHWIGLMGSVTSPVSRSDKGWDLMQRSDQIRSMYAMHSASWMFNPKLKREHFDEEYIKDPIGAERDYGANPPGASHPLLHDEKRWLEVAVDEREPAVRFETYYRNDPTGHAYKGAKVSAAAWASDRAPRYIVFDAGETFDAFAFVLGCGQRNEEGQLLTIVEGVGRILPEPGVEVLFQSAVDIVDRLRQTMLISRVEFDRWQSIQVIQQIRALGIFAEKRSLAKKDYVSFKKDGYSGIVRMLPPEEGERKEDAVGFVWTRDPTLLSGPAIALYELSGLQQDPDTGTVSNPKKGEKRGHNSNDVAQCIVHLHTLVQSAGYTERQDDRSKRAARLRAEDRGRGFRGSLIRPAMAAGRAKVGGRGW